MAQPEQIHGGLIATVRGEDVVQPWEYERIHSGGTQRNPSSENWAIVAVSVDAWRKSHGRSSIWSLDQSFVWLLVWLGDQERPDYGHMGAHEVRSGIYSRYMALGVRAMRGLGILHGRADVVAACDRWLRCYYAISALLAIRGQAANLTYAEEQAAEGPGVLTGTHPGPWADPLTVADCGGRSWSTQGSRDGLMLVMSNFADKDLSEVLGLREASELTHALWAQRADLASFPISDSERADMIACIDGDPQAAVRVAAISGSYPCHYDYSIFRWEGEAAQSILHRYSGSSTAPSCSKLAQDQGRRIDVLVCDPGGRNSGADDWDVGPSTTVLDTQLLTVTAARNDGRYPPVSMPLYATAWTFRALWGPQGIKVIVPFEAEPPGPAPVPPPPTPKPAPKKKKRGCFGILLICCSIAGALLAGGLWAVLAQ